MKRSTMGFGIMLLVAGTVLADKPVQLSITPDVALYGRSETITGVTLGLWSENQQTALALGVINGSTGQSAGLSWAFLLNYAENYTGIHWAPINYTSGDFLGWQAGFVNYAGSMTGLQSGTVNIAGRLTGLQFGFVNYAEKVDTGLQIGLLNIMPQNQMFTALPEALAPAMIFVNWRF
jgi:hypothetical protein